MTLYEQLREDMKTAMRAKDSLTLDVVRMSISSIKNKAMELNKELDESEVVAVMKSDAKKIKESLDMFVASAREDLAGKARQELAILEKYLPAQMADGELIEKVKAKIAEMGITDPAQAGKIVGALAKELKGLVDGSRIKAKVDEFLSKKE